MLLRWKPRSPVGLFTVSHVLLLLGLLLFTLLSFFIFNCIVIFFLFLNFLLFLFLVGELLPRGTKGPPYLELEYIWTDLNCQTTTRIPDH